MVLVACVPLGTSTVLFSNFIWSYIANQHREDGALLAHVLVSSLSGRVSGTWARRQGELLDSLSNDPRIAFVLVTDSVGKIAHAGLFDADAWNGYVSTQKQYEAKGVIDISKVVNFDRHKTGLIIRTAHIWDPPINFGETLAKRDHRKLEGAVVLGLRDPQVSGVLRDYQITQVALVLGAGVVCLPLARFLMSRWLRPLRALLDATRSIGQDETPRPVAVGTKDELGYLAGAFNEMAAKVAAHRRALMDANESLEQKVRIRTSELNDMVKRLDEMASTDPLTGLSNRRSFSDTVEPLFERAVLDDGDVTCLMIDLDGFKSLNDTVGHDAGDEVLVLTAKVLEEHCRSSDIAARLGGDEFVVLLPGADESSSQAIADAIIDHFEQKTIQMLSDVKPTLKVTMSIGLASRRASQPRTWEELLSQADKALYRAKGNGKACHVMYTDALAA